MFHQQQMKRRKVLVIGLGASGKSASEFLLKIGAQVLAVDQNKTLLESDEKLFELRQMGLQTYHDSQNFDMSSFDFIVVSPGVPQTNLLYQSAIKANREVIGEVELACRYIKHP